MTIVFLLASDSICPTPPVIIALMRLNRLHDEQLELRLPRPTLRIAVRRCRPARAKWWFEQMRRAVDSAVDWEPCVRKEQPRLLRG